MAALSQLDEVAFVTRAHCMVSALKGIVSALLLTANTLFCISLLIPLALIKLLLPVKPVRKLADLLLNQVAELWISINNGWIWLAQPGAWSMTGQLDFKRQGWYLVNSNHQSWVDILVLQRVFNRRIPLLKFFLKQELIYVPIMGFAWWALDFPFMRRQGGKDVAKDLATARQSCEKFKLIPTSVISFAEGTRFTAAKHAKQGSPHQHLLKAKVGALAMALDTMGPLFTAMIDVTIVYPDGVPSFADLLSGRVRNVKVHIEEVPIPSTFSQAEGSVGGALRPQLQSWINERWVHKDALIAQMRSK